MAKIFLGLAILFMLLSAVLGFLTKSKISDVRADLATTKATSASQAQQITKAQSDLKAAKSDNASLTQQAQASAKAASDAQAAIDSSKKEKDDIQKQLDDANTQVKTLTEQVANSKNSGTGTNTSQPSVDQQKLAELTTKVKEDSEINKKLTETNSSLQSQVDDFKKARNALTLQARARSLAGEVLAVQPSWNFVIVSIGDRQGVTMNEPLLVKRGATLVAKLRVTSVEPATSVADIISSSVPQGMRVMPGDRVIYSAP